MDRNWEQTGTFAANENDGTEQTIIVETLLFKYGSDRGAQEVEGQRRFSTSQGERVNYIGKGKYQIVRTFTKIDITSDDPNAP